MGQKTLSGNYYTGLNAGIPTTPPLHKKVEADSLFALVPTDEPLPNTVTRLEAWTGINKYRLNAPTMKTAFIVHPDEAIRRFINRMWVDLTENRFYGRPGTVYTWDVAFYYAINSKDQLTFYFMPIFVDEYGDELDYYTANYNDVDPVYYFRRNGSVTADAQDDDEIAFDYGHIRPTLLK